MSGAPDDHPNRSMGLEMALVEGDFAEIRRDPRKMTHDELRQCGHEPKPLLKAIRAHCLDCVGGSPAEVRRCTAVGCDLWVFRLSKNVWRAPPSEERKQAARERFLAARAAGAAPPVGEDDDDDLFGDE